MLTAENKLWRAVLGQAYDDAEMWADCPESVPSPADRQKARRYLRAESPYEATSLTIVCQYADVPADRIVLWARRRYKLAA
jgi:hypothetical protein